MLNIIPEVICLTCVIFQVDKVKIRDFDCRLALPLISGADKKLTLIVCRNPLLPKPASSKEENGGYMSGRRKYDISGSSSSKISGVSWEIWASGWVCLCCKCCFFFHHSLLTVMMRVSKSLKVAVTSQPFPFSFHCLKSFIYALSDDVLLEFIFEWSLHSSFIPQTSLNDQHPAMLQVISAVLSAGLWVHIPRSDMVWCLVSKDTNSLHHQSYSCSVMTNDISSTDVNHPTILRRGNVVVYICVLSMLNEKDGVRFITVNVSLILIMPGNTNDTQTVFVINHCCSLAHWQMT